MKKVLFALLILSYGYLVYGQACEYLGPDQFLPCGQTSTTITADFTNCTGGNTTPPKETSTYLVSNIPFAPESNAGTQVTLFDDQVTGALPIGFTFCFFGNTYTNFYIGSNGWISFSAGQPTTFTSAPIPSGAANVPKNCIMGPWQDWNPGVGGQIRYQTIGTAPCRKLVVSFNVVPFYSCTGTTGTFQIVLHEGTNLIDNHITNKQFCSWGGGTAVQGIHNLAGTIGISVPGRNSTQWTTTNNSHRYTPNGPNVSPILTWYQVGNPTPIATGVNSITVTPPAAGAHYTAVQQYSGCYINYAACVGTTGGIPQDTVFVMPNANINATFAGGLQYCQGDNIPPLPTTSTNNITGAWSPAINNQQTTTYTFTPDPGQCSDPVNLTITVLPNTLPNFAQVGPYCIGDAIPGLATISTNSISGTWSPAINNQQTTTYNFTPSAGQCALPTTMTIVINSGITPTFTQVGPFCTGTAIPALPTTSTNNIIGNWSPAINNTATGTYTFTPNPGQCAGITTMNITINQLIQPQFSAVGPFCANANIGSLPTSSINNIIGSWSPNINNQTTTNYTFSPNPGQCAATATMSITINPNITPTFTQVGPYCADVQIPELPTTSINNYNGTWSPAISNTQSGTYTFTPNSGLCATPTSMSIEIIPNQIPTFNPVAPYCFGTNVPDLPTVSNNNFTGVWTPSINNQATTNYTFIPDAGLCAFSTTQIIEILPNAFSTTNITLCESELPISWNGLTITSGGQYTAILNAQNGCDSLATLNMNVNQTLTGMSSVTVCQNQIPYNWNGNSLTLSGVYTANLMSSIGCDSIGMLNLTVVPLPQVSFTSSSTQGCAPLNVTFTNTSETIGSCLWELGNGLILNSCTDVLGVYNTVGCHTVSLQVTTPEGCSNTQTFENMICIDPDPIASFFVTPSTLTTLNPTATFTNNSINSETQVWYFGDNSQSSSAPNPSYTYPSQMAYYTVSLVITNVNGCKDSTSQTILVDNQVIYYIPNTFSPNSDEVNDTFRPIFTSGFDPYAYNFLVFNRWGEVLFESKNPSIGWDGTFGGQICPSGTYIWQVRYKEIGKDRHDEINGHFHLMK